ncbi:MAG: hypothetical protein QXJ61_05865, partial [Candidatus Nitrosocaldus sp.]
MSNSHSNSNSSNQDSGKNTSSNDEHYDPAEQIIMVKKLLDMKRRMLEQRQKSDREILLEHLTDRGEEV